MKALDYKKYYFKYMFFMAFFGNLSSYAQAYELVTSRSVKGVSIPAFVLACFSSLSWMVYGFLKKDYPIIIGNLIGAIGALLVIDLILLYK